LSKNDEITLKINHVQNEIVKSNC